MGICSRLGWRLVLAGGSYGGGVWVVVSFRGYRGVFGHRLWDYFLLRLF